MQSLVKCLDHRDIVCMLLILLHIKSFYRRTLAEVVQKHVTDDNMFDVVA